MTFNKLTVKWKMQASNNVPPARVQQPLPESDFVVEARESIPLGRQKFNYCNKKRKSSNCNKGKGCIYSARKRKRKGRNADTGRAATATRGRGTTSDQQRGRGRVDLHVLAEKDQLNQAQVELHTKLPEEAQEEAMQQALTVSTTCVLVMAGLTSMHF
jgi:hypothetical protein